MWSNASNTRMTRPAKFKTLILNDAEADALPALMGVVHETGHGRYEQNLPREWLGLPVAQARSMGLHESQSLSFEMQLGSHPGFARLLAPLLNRHLGEQPAFAPDNLVKLLTRVKPGYIRVEADEVTYPAHVMLRFEIERGCAVAAVQGGRHGLSVGWVRA